jgi:hypothetical protein
MSRHLRAVPDVGIPTALVGDLFNEVTATMVISGELIHNVETDLICPAESATPEFKAEAAEAYKRFLIARDAHR